MKRPHAIFARQAALTQTPECAAVSRDDLRVQYIPGAPSEEKYSYGARYDRRIRGVLSLARKTSPRSTDWVRWCSRWPVRPSIQISFGSRSPTIKHIYLRPDDPEPYYWVGVIDWTPAFRATQPASDKVQICRAGRQLSDDAPLPPTCGKNMRGRMGQLSMRHRCAQRAISIKRTTTMPWLPQPGV